MNTILKRGAILKSRSTIRSIALIGEVYQHAEPGSVQHEDKTIKLLDGSELHLDLVMFHILDEKLKKLHIQETEIIWVEYRDDITRDVPLPKFTDEENDIALTTFPDIKEVILNE